MPVSLPAVVALPGDILTIIYDLAHSVGPKSDGGRKVTLAELEKIEADAAQLLQHASALLASVRPA